MLALVEADGDSGNAVSSVASICQAVCLSCRRPVENHETLFYTWRSPFPTASGKRFDAASANSLLPLVKILKLQVDYIG